MPEIPVPPWYIHRWSDCYTSSSPHILLRLLQRGSPDNLAVGPTFIKRFPPRETGVSPHKHTNQHFRRLPCHFIPVVSPGTGKGLAGFPCDQFPGFRMANPVRWLILFRGPDILIYFCTIINDNTRLEFASQR